MPKDCDCESPKGHQNCPPCPPCPPTGPGSSPPGDPGKKNPLVGKLDPKYTKLLAGNTFAKQFVGGTATGLVTGAMVSSAGRGIALVLGSGILLMQVAQHQGYIKQDWNALKEMAEKKGAEMGAVDKLKNVNKVKSFASKNKVFTAGFLGGFLLGMAV